MSNDVSLTKENLARSSLWGIARGISVHSFIYPLEVIKIRQQCLQNQSKSIQIAMTILRQEGIGAFYKGLAPQLLKTSIKQIWCWPMITFMPSFLQRHHIENLRQQALTGLSISTIDAVISTPLEKAKIVSAFRGTSTFSFKHIYKERWKGFITHWSKLSVNWIVFLMAQKHFRDHLSASSRKPLSLAQLAKIGVQVALLVSLASAPFDIANSLKQAKNKPPSHLFSRQGIFKLYRGWPLSALSLVVHNIASITLIEKLGNSIR